MQDAIIKGNGNSRFLKTVAAALSLYPTYEDFLQALVAGNFPIDLNGINADGWTQQGTPLNKGNLLSDTVEKAIWNNIGNRTVNDALSVLGDVGNIHVWKRDTIYEEGVTAGYTLGDAEEYLYDLSNNPSINAYTGISVDNQGNLSGIGTPTSISATYDNYLRLSDAVGKFVKVSVSGGIAYYYIPEDAVPIRRIPNVGFSQAQLVTGYPEIPAGTVTDYPTSTDRNAFGEGFVDYKPAYWELGTAEKLYFVGQTGVNYSVYNPYAENVSVSDDGVVSGDFSTSVELSYNTYSAASVLLGKFVKSQSNVGGLPQEGDKIYFIPETASILRGTENVNGTTYYTVYTTDAQLVIGYPETGSAYLTYLGALGDKARIEVGSYVGTGTYGGDNPNILTFTGKPCFVAIQKKNNQNLRGYFIRGTSITSIREDVATYYYVSNTWGDNTLSFWQPTVNNNTNAVHQLNEANAEYCYMAVLE